MKPSFIFQIHRYANMFLSLWVVREFIILNKLAIPNILAFILTNFGPFVTVIFAGHIRKEDKFLDGTSLALSFANITGNAVSIGLSSGLETLCSQSYGARQYRRSGLHFQKSLLIHFLICFPLAGLWINTESILLLLHQDKQVSRVAGQFMSIYFLSLPAIQITFLTLKLLQSHNYVFPQIVIILCGLLANIFGQYFLVSYYNFGILGSSTAITICQYVTAFGYIMYIRFSHLYHQTWGSWRLEALYDWWHYLKYGLPGMLMLCFEWWSFESGYFSVGAFAPYPKVELGIYSVVLNIADIIFSIALGYTISATVRVGNLLGRNEPQNARHTTYLLFVLILITGTTQCVIIYFPRNLLARLFTENTCILAGSSWPIIVVALFQIVDGFQAVAGGVLKGCGKQALGAVINVVTFQFLSLPLSFYLAFGLKWYTAGFLVGLAIGILIHGVGYAIALSCVDWDETAKIALKNAGVLTEKENSEGKFRYEDFMGLKSGSDEENTFMSHSMGVRNVSRESDSSQERCEMAESPQDTQIIFDNQNQTCSKQEFILIVANRSLTLLLCILFLALGVILRTYNFSISIYTPDSTNYSYCPYIDQ